VWCDPLPARVDRNDLARLVATDRRDAAVVGLVDLPDQQSRDVMRWSPADGSTLVVGSPGSGVTSTLVTLAVSALESELSAERPGGPTRPLFVVDAGHDAAWDAVAAHARCAGVVRLHERERLWRLLRRVLTDAGPGAEHGAVVVIDGLAALRHELDALERAGELELLDRVLGSAGVTLLLGADRAGAVPAAVSARCPVRIVLHLHDAHDGVMLGVPAGNVPPPIPGRAAVDGTTVQLLAPRPVRDTGRPARPVRRIETLPTRIGPDDLPPAAHLGDRWRAPLGIGFADLAPLTLDVVDGEHLLIAGPPRSGRSSAIELLRRAWLASDPDAEVVVVAARRSPLAGTGSLGTLDEALTAVRGSLDLGRRTMLAVDDAELFDDPSGWLVRAIGERHPGFLVVAAARPDALRQSYGHWSAAVRRSRLGLLASGCSDVDGDLLGVTLPRRMIVRPRPGLMHRVDAGEAALVQLAVVAPEPAAAERARVS
jgi:S-DNA-T family DNA segregation ATPase FtsK/SpoIIIE